MEDKSVDVNAAPPPTDEAIATQSTAIARRRPKPASLVQVGDRWVTSDGRFHPWLAADYIKDRGRTQWVTVADLAKVFAGGNNNAGKRRVRKNMHNVFVHVLNLGHFLLYETGDRGRINAVKLLDAQSPFELESAGPQLERMRQRRQIATDKYEKARGVIELREQL